MESNLEELTMSDPCLENSSFVKRLYVRHVCQTAPHGPSHVFQDFDPPFEIRAWYGQDQFNLPEGPGVLIHCVLPPNSLNVPFFDYPTRPWVACQYDCQGTHYYTSPTGQLFWAV